MIWTDKNGKPCLELLAIPPDDYEGTMADWFIKLEEKGYNAEEYCDVILPANIYEEILKECEGE